MDTYLVFIVLYTVSISTFALAFREICQTEDKRTLKCNYIPKDIPSNITNVHIVDFNVTFKSFNITESNFQSENWASVKYLELSSNVSEVTSSVNLQSKCFHGLTQLQELHIHLMTPLFLDPETFIGLDRVKFLDMSDCTRLNLQVLAPSLSGKKVLPTLEHLKFSRSNSFRMPLEIDTTFVEALKDKNITHLDFSDTKIADINVASGVEYMKHLQILNLSFSLIAHMDLIRIDVDEFAHVKVIDFSHAQVPLGFPSGIYKLSNENLKVSNINRGKVKILQNLITAKIVNATAVVPQFISFMFHNCTLDVNEPLRWRSEQFIIRQNNLKLLDIKMLCNKHAAFTIKHIDLAQNGIEFLHPSVLSCLPNLKTLDLSINQLFKMNLENRSLFGKLFTSLQYLKSIHFSFNDLKTIPDTIFEHNHDLEEIDLSHNNLDQITFTIRHLKKLKVLDLQNNNIKILNKVSLHNLDSIKVEVKNQVNIKTKVLLKFNPISCSECDAKPFLQWLTKTNLVIKLEPDLYCIAKNREHRNINSDTVELVQIICNRKKIIISASVVSGLVTIVAIVTIIVIYKRRKWAKIKANKMICLGNLLEGQGQYEFVAFLSYSSEDADFVKDFVMEKLNENLQLLTGIDRELVCTGDKYLRPGFLILDETVRCMEKATVVISIVSNSYCDSRYCHNELDQAYRLNKPIILMLKEQVDENLMMPTMKMLFKNNVRILWTTNNDQYVLKTTWENVCKSILDLVASNA